MTIVHVFTFEILGTLQIEQKVITAGFFNERNERKKNPQLCLMLMLFQKLEHRKYKPQTDQKATATTMIPK